jgi:hypothetical protein
MMSINHSPRLPQPTNKSQSQKPGPSDRDGESVVREIGQHGAKVKIARLNLVAAIACSSQTHHTRQKGSANLPDERTNEALARSALGKKRIPTECSAWLAALLA